MTAGKLRRWQSAATIQSRLAPQSMEESDPFIKRRQDDENSVPDSLPEALWTLPREGIIPPTSQLQNFEAKEGTQCNP